MYQRVADIPSPDRWEKNVSCANTPEVIPDKYAHVSEQKGCACHKNFFSCWKKKKKKRQDHADDVGMQIPIAPGQVRFFPSIKKKKKERKKKPRPWSGYAFVIKRMNAFFSFVPWY